MRPPTQPFASINSTGLRPEQGGVGGSLAPNPARVDPGSPPEQTTVHETATPGGAPHPARPPRDRAHHGAPRSTGRRNVILRGRATSGWLSGARCQVKSSLGS
jgi:hypothetical protein